MLTVESGSQATKWKLKTEGGNGQILSTSHLEKTYAKLSQTLKIWQWHRPCKFSELAPRLRNALEKISES
jgi:hypothetical protein